MSKRLKLTGVLLAGMMLLSACGGSGAASGSAPAASGADGAAAGGEKVFRMALEQDIETIDPQQNTARYTTTIAEGISESLLREHNGEMLPGVAESYETQDFITWTFKLRADAQWSDGTPITAEDFVYSYKEIFHRAEAAKVYILFEGVKGYTDIAAALQEGKTGDELRAVTDTLGVTAIDAQTLQVELDSPRPYFAEIFASTAWAPIKKDLYEANGTAYGSAADKIGMNGPFVLKEWKFNEELVLVPNDKYWDKENIKLDRVEIKIVKDIEPRVNMFKEGQVDFAVASSENYNTLSDRVVTAPGSGNYYLLLNYQRRDAEGKVVNPAVSDLLANRNFVNAISSSLDRTTLFGSVLESPAFLASGWIVPDHININNAAREDVGTVRTGTSPNPVTADSAKAKEYLAKAMEELGYTDVSQIPEISIVVASSPDPRTIVEYVQLAVEQELGIKLNLDVVEFNVRDSRIISGDYDMLYMGWGVSVNDPLGYLDVWADNLFATGWPEADPDSYAEYVALVDKIRTATDMDARAKDILAAEQLALEHAPLIPLGFSNEVCLLQSNVQNFQLRMFNAPYDYIYVEKA